MEAIIFEDHIILSCEVNAVNVTGVIDLSQKIGLFTTRSFCVHEGSTDPIFFMKSKYYVRTSNVMLKLKKI